ncbi:MAG: hypothetical protein KKH02_03650 [Proteobacteria bacterium]|nr:hypothetical protein [Pseudomonadota bacterium]MCG2740860.1 hypothetical protein [Syntrophaceae bacterium]
MVTIEEAQRTILEYITPLETEKVSVFQGLNRVTPEDHIAPWDIPAADHLQVNGAPTAFPANGQGATPETRRKQRGTPPSGPGDCLGA